MTDKSGIAYVMRIEREFGALLSLQLNRTPHHRRPFLISEACFHCHAPPCTPLCLRVSGKNEMKKKLGGLGGFFNCETHGKFLRLFVAMKETWNWGVAVAASPSGEWPRKTSMWVSQAPFFAVSSKPFLGNGLREDLVEVGSGARAGCFFKAPFASRGDP
ncbi:MAG: hypothetical protein ACOX9C_07665, partial [Kiritimatiellia bacterium]